MATRCKMYIIYAAWTCNANNCGTKVPQLTIYFCSFNRQSLLVSIITQRLREKLLLSFVKSVIWRHHPTAVKTLHTWRHHPTAGDMWTTHVAPPSHCGRQVNHTRGATIPLRVRRELHTWRHHPTAGRCLVSVVQLKEKLTWVYMEINISLIKIL